MKNIAFILLTLLPNWLASQQIADSTYAPVIHHPAYEPGKGPVVFIDEGHHNFHTKDGRYMPFAKLLQQDGYQVHGYMGSFTPAELAKGKILVISNALHESNVHNWYKPNPSAFTHDEITVVRQWVEHGGNLFLIADHMPLAGAAQELAAAFGFEFTNGFALDTVSGGASQFSIADRTLSVNTITKGRDADESVDQIVSFTGQAFQIPGDATPILIFNEHHINLLPDTAWVFTDDTPMVPVKGWSQGAFKKFGNGRLVVFGEAAMFSAQLAGPNRRKTGMNSASASQNYQLLLNIIHWLDGKLE
jgi:hypothetical protein